MIPLRGAPFRCVGVSTPVTGCRDASSRDSRLDSSRGVHHGDGDREKKMRREGKRREEKGREEKGREGKGRQGKGREGKGVAAPLFHHLLSRWPVS
jgi:hypothetical protein